VDAVLLVVDVVLLVSSWALLLRHHGRFLHDRRCPRRTTKHREDRPVFKDHEDRASKTTRPVQGWRGPHEDHLVPHEDHLSKDHISSHHSKDHEHEETSRTKTLWKTAFYFAGVRQSISAVCVDYNGAVCLFHPPSLDATTTGHAKGDRRVPPAVRHVLDAMDSKRGHLPQGRWPTPIGVDQRQLRPPHANTRLLDEATKRWPGPLALEISASSRRNSLKVQGSEGRERRFALEDALFLL
jgi:hypothetical protein